MIKPVKTTPPEKAADAGLLKAAQGFEAMLLRQMIGAMRQAKLGDDLLGSSASDTYREMADRQLADSMARLGQFGIADALATQFLQKDKAQ